MGQIMRFQEILRTLAIGDESSAAVCYRGVDWHGVDARSEWLGGLKGWSAPGHKSKTQREERYHALFAETWLTRLARGAAGGPGRVQAALDAAWPDAQGLFEGTDADDVLLHAGVIGTSPDAQRAAWLEVVRPTLEGCGLRVPSGRAREGGRRGVHTAAFERLHAEMTEVWRSDPEARW